MKFCPVFSSCCRPTAKRTTAIATQAPLLSRTEDVGDAKSHQSESETTQWRPKLSMIAEDGVVADSDIKLGQREKKSSSSRSTVKQRKFGSNNEYCRNTLPMIIPAFSPTPFMF
ncbi:uncharacterized protein LOC120001019 [Tripterygium wilfordii]|uniref:uncharacterized protein LOC120001019 n=1 Tax=Tripterygium wilfordii TaxID=458696 RepID=UPI0018F7EBD8|nr:uncharacterized protein LOC120001019 [Tripterygium wilfordii]